MKTAELTGAALDWAVTQCELKAGIITENSDDLSKPLLFCKHLFGTYETGVTELGKQQGHPELRRGSGSAYKPSTDWRQAGPIIEREKISLDFTVEPNIALIIGLMGKATVFGTGDTPLIAAMRCYVASRLGGDVEIPKELI